MQFKKILFALVCLIPLFAHADQEAMLSESDAQVRSSLISHVQYDLRLTLQKGSPKFLGKVKIGFSYLKDKAKGPLRIDFDKGTIQNATINGTAVDPSSLKGSEAGTLLIPNQNLVQGSNEIELLYDHPYSTIGKGLYRFTDEEDKQEYVYTDLEPYGANQVLPCFDQPDLKAVFKLKVDAPKEWQVIGNAPEKSTEEFGDLKSVTFEATAPMSTYIFAAVAGPYQVWKDQYKNVPIRVFARKSIAKFVDIQAWLDVTKKGLGFYEGFYKYDYPFKKYDQILVPDFGPGAMENVAAVTFNESYYIFRSPPTVKQKMILAETVLHEMAHMWFGDLVTMKWWNDLWLNESFATYMSTLAVKGLKEYDDKEVDVYFFNNMKKWAYFEDGLSTTHPISVKINNTSDALSNFDGITYGKGGAVLKQIHYMIGDEAFRKGLLSYFNKYHFQNTELKDFIGELATASGRDLNAWQKEWFQTKGTNTVTASFACDGPRLRSITLEQSDSDHADSVARTHSAELGLYYVSRGSDLYLYKTIPVTFSGRKWTLDDATVTNQVCPALVLPNENDHDYAKTEFGADSVKLLKTYLTTIENGMSRQLAWYSLWEQVEAGKLPASEYLAIALEHLAKEKDLQIVDDVVTNLLGDRYQDLSIAKIYKPEARAPIFDAIFAIARAQMAKMDAGSSNQMVWLRIMLRSLRSAESVDWAKQVVAGGVTIPGQKIEYDIRWDFMDALAHAHALTQDQIKKELGSNADDTSNDRALQALGGMSEPRLNQTLFDLFQGKKVPHASDVSFLLTDDLKPTTLEMGMKKYLSILDEPKTDAIAQSYFTDTLTMSREMGENLMWDYGTYMYPSTCNDEPLAVRDEFFKAIDTLYPPMAVEIRRSREVELRCIRARALVK